MVAATLALLAASFSSAEECSEALCIHHVKIESGGYKVFIENLGLVTQKIRLSVGGKNIRVIPEETVDLLLPGLEKELALTVLPKNPQKPWSYNYEYMNRETEGSSRNCFQDMVCVSVIFNDDIFEFFVENKKISPITVRIEDSGFLNLNVSSSLPSLETYPPSSTTLAFSANLIDEWKPWNYPFQVKYQIGTLKPRHDNSFLYRLPYAIGESHKVTQGFNGEKTHQNTFAIDWAMPEGTPVYAAREGIVIDKEERYSEGGTEEKYKSKENHINILHDDGTIASYVHLKKHGALVDIGDSIKAGDKIGYSGDTGYSSGPHLHFDVFGINKDLEMDTIPVRFLNEDADKELKAGKFYTAINPKPIDKPNKNTHI